MTTLRKDVETRLQELIQEYGDEAEHQDGEEYWDRFETVDDAIKDIQVYIGIVLEDQHRDRKQS